MKRLLIVLLILASVCSLAGCHLFFPNTDTGDSNDGDLAEFTVRFISNGGSKVDSIVATEGETIGEPDAPTYEGMIFEGWYKDRELLDPWDFEFDVVIEDTKLYAKWSVDTDYHVHKYEEEVTAPTCDKEGYTTYTCECGDSYVDDKTDPLGHKYVVRVVEADCTKGGYTEYTCEVCSDNYIDSESIIPASGHDYTYEIVAATCTEGGYTTKTCSTCSVSETFDVVGALGHDYKADVTEPTCTEGGYTTNVCSRCSDSYVSDNTVPKGHTPGADADCVNAKTCTVCGEVLEAALGHTPGAEATCTDPQTCTVCHEVLVEALGHKPVEGTSCTDATFCDRCKEVLESLSHNFAPATCTLPETCRACGATRGEPRGHIYVPEVTEPTCTEGGYTTYTCECSDTYISDYVSSLGHNHVVTEVIEPTCTDGGYSVYTCTRCSDSYNGDTTSNLGHTYDVHGKCTVCGTLSPECVKVTYKLNGGNNYEGNLDYFLPDEIPTLYDPETRSGYRFDGWYTDSSFTTRITSFEGVKSDITIYAKWIVVYGPSDSDGIVTPEIPF